MAVYKRSYRTYEGTTTAQRWRFLVLTRYGFAGMFDSRPFTVAFVLSLVPFLLALVMMYVSHSNTVRALLHLQGPNPIEVNNYFFAGFLGLQAWLAFLLTTWQGPQLIAGDLANNGLPLILSRPISRTEYVLGKFGVLAVLLSVITWLPTLILLLVQAALEGHGWLWSHLWLAGSIFLAAWMWIAIVGLFALAISAWLRWRVAASAMMLALFFVGPAFGGAVNLILDTTWGHVLDVMYAAKVIWFRMFRVPIETLDRLHVSDLPLWAAWCSVISICAISVLLLNRRLKAREVVRG
jgi:ABC-2 type transport system permease protein